MSEKIISSPRDCRNENGGIARHNFAVYARPRGARTHTHIISVRLRSRPARRPNFFGGGEISGTKNLARGPPGCSRECAARDENNHKNAPRFTPLCISGPAKPQLEIEKNALKIRKKWSEKSEKTRALIAPEHDSLLVLNPFLIWRGFCIPRFYSPFFYFSDGIFQILRWVFFWLSPMPQAKK